MQVDAPRRGVIFFVCKTPEKKVQAPRDVPAPAASEVASESVTVVRKRSRIEIFIDFKHHFCGRPSLKQCVILTFTIAAIASVIVFTSTGQLHDLSDKLALIGWRAHLIFFALLIYTGMPFGYGWSFCCISAGYVLGWWAVLTVNFGTQCGCALGVLVSRRYLRRSVEKKIESLPTDWSHTIRLVQHKISRNRIGYLSCAGLVGNCGITAGLANAIYGALTDAPVFLIMLGVFLSSEWAIILDVYLGRLMRDLSDGASDEEASSGDSNATANNDSNATRRYAIVAQLSVAVVFATLVSLWARHRLKAMSRESGVPNDSQHEIQR